MSDVTVVGPGSFSLVLVQSGRRFDSDFDFDLSQWRFLIDPGSRAVYDSFFSAASRKHGDEQEAVGDGE
jgi:hypothetical protein